MYTLHIKFIKINFIKGIIKMTRAECFENEIENLDKEIRRFEQLNMT